MHHSTTVVLTLLLGVLLYKVLELYLRDRKNFSNNLATVVMKFAFGVAIAVNFFKSLFKSKLFKRISRK